MPERLSGGDADMVNLGRLRRVEADNKRLRAALDRAQKFIRLGNHPNADDLLEQISRALRDD